MGKRNFEGEEICQGDQGGKDDKSGKGGSGDEGGKGGKGGKGDMGGKGTDTAASSQEQSPRNNGKKHATESHQERTCEGCGSKRHWRKMWNEHVTVFKTWDAQVNCGWSAEIGDVKSGRQVGNFVYWCDECCAKHWSVDIETARKWMRPIRNKKGLERIERFKESIKRAEENWAFILVVNEEKESVDKDSQIVRAKSKKKFKTELRKIANEKMGEIFSPMIEILATKCLDEEAALEKCDAYQKRAAAVSAGASEEELAQLVLQYHVVV